MKVKIMKCSDPKAWYADRVGQEIDVEYVPPQYIGEHRDRKISLKLVAKTWNWYWRRSKLQTIPLDDCIITDNSGSSFKDGFELGKVWGAVEKEQQLIDEGILEADPDDDDDVEHPIF